MFKKFFLATTAAALVSTGGFAADLPARTYTKAPVMVEPVFNWSGFYLGGFLGGAFTSGDATSTDPRNVTPGFPYNGPLDNSYRLSDSVIGGGTIGYNWQTPGTNFVAGIEGEFGYLHLHRQVQDVNAINDHFAFPDSLDTTRIGDWYGLIAGRAGVTFNNVLFYGKAGIAFVNKSYSFNDSCTTGGCGGGTLVLGTNKTQATWAAGAGIEYGFSNNWSVKGEYLYIDTSESYASTGVGGGTAAGVTYSNTHSDPGIHTVKLGLNYRFNWTPVVAKY